MRAKILKSLTQGFGQVKNSEIFDARVWAGQNSEIFVARVRAGPIILVPRKNGEPERRSLSVCRGVRGAASPPPGGLGGWKPPSKSCRGSGGRQPPSKNNFCWPLLLSTRGGGIGRAQCRTPALKRILLHNFQKCLLPQSSNQLLLADLQEYRL